jgi:hypothetical protein
MLFNERIAASENEVLERISSHTYFFSLSTIRWGAEGGNLSNSTIFAVSPCSKTWAVGELMFGRLGFIVFFMNTLEIFHEG